MRCSSVLRSSPTSSQSGEPSIRMCADRRTSAHALRTINAHTSNDNSGSIGSQPVNRMTTPARIAATEPSKSPNTCSVAAAMFMSCASPRRSIANTIRFTPRPSPPTHRIAVALTGTGVIRRCTASIAIHATMNSSAQPLTKVASTRSR